MDIEEKIKEIENRINGLSESNSNKANLIYSLIQLKLNSDRTSTSESVYIDVKNFIKVYIISIENKDYGYDVLDTKKIIKAISFLPNINNQYKLLQYAYRNLKADEFEEESLIIKNKLNRIKTSILNSNNKFFYSFIHQCSFSVKTISISMFILFAITAIIFLPAPHESMELYNIKYENYDSNFYVNHVLNIMSKIAGINNKFTIETSSIVGLISLIFLKFLYVIFIMNFLYEKMKDIIKG